MATIVDVQSNRAIQFNGSEKLTRTFVKDPGAIDIRVAVIVSGGRSGTFNPVSSVFETFQFGLMNSGRTTPFDINSATNAKGNQSVLTERCIRIGGYLGGNHGIGQGYYYYDFNVVTNLKVAYELNGVTSGPTISNINEIQYGYPFASGQGGTSQSEVWLLRIFKSSVNSSNITFQMRQKGWSTPATYESNLHDMLSNLTNTDLVVEANFTTTDSTNWDSLDTLILTWPFYNSQFNVHAMAYRSLPAS